METPRQFPQRMNAQNEEETWSLLAQNLLVTQQSDPLLQALNSRHQTFGDGASFA